MGQKWLFAPLVMEEDKPEPLLSNATKHIPGSEKIDTASDATVYLKRVYINKGHESKLKFWEKKDTNDLLIVTKFNMGTQPRVQRVHKYAPNIKIGHSQDFVKSIVCSYQDVKGGHLSINPQIYDVDSYKDFKDNVKDLTELIGKTGVFPALTPYASVVSSIAKSFADLVDKLDSHDAIINDTLRLEMVKENTGSKIIQSGHWACFAEEQDEGLTLDDNLRVINADGTDFSGCSYVVYTIRKKHDEEPEWEISQKVATLLTELKGKGESGKAGISFLRDTMKGYNNFKKLNRIKELEGKSEQGDLSKEEEERLKKLKADPELEKHLPDKG